MIRSRVRRGSAFWLAAVLLLFAGSWSSPSGQGCVLYYCNNYCDLPVPSAETCNLYCGQAAIVYRMYYSCFGQECYEGECYNLAYDIFDPPPRECWPGVAFICDIDYFNADFGGHPI